VWHFGLPPPFKIAGALAGRLGNAYLIEEPEIAYE
jgi:hypothetical protein